MKGKLNILSNLLGDEWESSEINKHISDKFKTQEYESKINLNKTVFTYIFQIETIQTFSNNK